MGEAIQSLMQAIADRRDIPREGSYPCELLAARDLSWTDVEAELERRLK